MPSLWVGHSVTDNHAEVGVVHNSYRRGWAVPKWIGRHEKAGSTRRATLK
jgi:hypothetical protein